MSTRPRPSNTWVTSVFNPGFDKRIPLGFVEMVYDKKTGNPVGYMRSGNFYPLGVNAETFDAEEKKKAEGPTYNKMREQQIAAQATPISAQVSTKGLVVTTDPTNGTTYVSGMVGTGPNAIAQEHFIYLRTIPEKGQTLTRAPGASEIGGIKSTPGGEYTLEITNDYDRIRNLVLSEAQTTPGGMDSLFSTMYSAGLISKETFQRKDISNQEFNKGLQYALRNYSVNVIDDFTIGGATEAEGFLSYLGAGFQKAGPTSRTTYDSVITKRQDAAEEADRFFMSYLGRGANKREEDEYYKILRDAEKKNIVATTAKYDAEGKLISSTKTGELVSETDRLFMLGKVAGTAIKGGNLEKIMTRGGQAAAEVNQIMTLASNYGVSLTQQDAVNYVADNLTKGKTLDSTKNKIIKLSKIKYGNIANLIDNEMSVSDIAVDFINNYAALTGTPVNSIDIFNPLIQSALTNNGQPGVMKENDFKMLIKNDPTSRSLWLNTPQAKDEAAAYTYNILKTFGLVA